MENKELDVLEVKADALAANIMHRDGYIVRDDKGYTATGTFVSAVIHSFLQQPNGEEALNKFIELIDKNTKEIKDE